jgi:hypothetical protein
LTGPGHSTAASGTLSCPSVPLAVSLPPTRSLGSSCHSGLRAGPEASCICLFQGKQRGYTRGDTCYTIGAIAICLKVGRPVLAPPVSKRAAFSFGSRNPWCTQNDACHPIALFASMRVQSRHPRCGSEHILDGSHTDGDSGYGIERRRSQHCKSAFVHLLGFTMRYLPRFRVYNQGMSKSSAAKTSPDALNTHGANLSSSVQAATVNNESSMQASLIAGRCSSGGRAVRM